MNGKTTWFAYELEHAMTNSGPAPREDAKVALVQFDGSTKTYCYWVLPGTTPRSTLMVHSPYRGPTRVTVVAIKRMHECALSSGRLKLAVSQTQFNRMELAKVQGKASSKAVHAAPPLAPETTGSKAAAPQQSSMDVYTKFVEQFTTRATHSPNVTFTIDLIDSPKENSTMNIEITNATFINGTDVKNYTDSQLMGMMQQLDKDIAQLKAMEPLPKRFAKRLEKLEASKQALFELLDSAE